MNISPFILWLLRSLLALHPDVATDANFSFEVCACRVRGRHGGSGEYRGRSVAFESCSHLLLTQVQCVEAARFLSLQ